MILQRNCLPLKYFSGPGAFIFKSAEIISQKLETASKSKVFPANLIQNIIVTAITEGRDIIHQWLVSS